MITYPDTSYLCALYREQDNSDIALAYDEQMSGPLYVSTLLEFEFRQAVRLQVWLHAQNKRKGYSQGEANSMMADWETDIAAGHVAIIPADMDAVLRMAEHLSSTHTCHTGNRTLDILHVATAKHLSAKEFLSFDARQRQLAKAAGLKVPV
ncbi:putative nucleic acid-binding protein [Prosthecobacter fusiformis]|uniref:Putative nucleic acid-binding protein n=1 Tax=Prosthecobacter fusiformis TaxID=48464 RepID=A0A4R7RR77_9BACT|nr:type II toxin-antitoxin system VapC family toxin [Prosthecobacter fusiformis]TDU68031.1 putative nucleic acid-binding protein [Prosthecobacter fusiformis]